MRLLLLDTETTGLPIDGTPPGCVELACALVDTDAPQSDLRKVPHYVGLHDPGVSISPEASRKSGITDDMVRGHAINVSEVADLMSRADACLAFNAPFDRGVISAFSLPPKRWFCGLRQIDWTGAHGLRYASLEFLVLHHLLRRQNHRAFGDIQDVWDLLQAKDINEPEGPTYLQELLDATQDRWGIVYLPSTPFGSNEAVKSLGFRFHRWPKEKGGAWWRPTREAALQTLGSQLDAIGCRARKFRPCDITQPNIERAILEAA